MNKIHILDDKLINMIAAGEVVERPKSIVKELVENSLDAQASEITINLRNGGKNLIQIIDNGIGMSKDDLLLAFERHATSKIKTEEDMSKISTMGFRGEALPSIAAVSRIEAVSKEQSTFEAYKLVINGGVISDLIPTPLQSSTDIKIRSLFYNVPARRKFLKSEQTEYKHIYTLLKKIAIGNPSVAFKLIHNERTIFDLKADTLQNRILEIFKEISPTCLIPLEVKDNNINISGYIGTDELSRKYRDNQYLFVNKRVVENRMINYTVLQSFKKILDEGYFPFFIIYIQLPNEDIDINIHPAKIEVKFHNESNIRSMLSTKLEDVLGNSNFISTFSFRKEKEPDKSLENEQFLFNNQEIPYTPPIVPGKVKSIKENSYISTPEIIKGQYVKEENKNSEQYFRPQKKGIDILRIGNDNIVAESVWQLHNKYIFIQVESGTLIIDQHVAQERIFYERALQSLSSESQNSQNLLLPIRIELSYEDKKVLEEIYDHLNNLGYKLSHFGNNTYLVEAIPVGVSIQDEKKEILDLIDNYKQYKTNDSFGKIEAVAASYACKRSIKAGKSLSDTEILGLINDLFLCQFPHVCPHGRPVITNLTMYELDKKFKRV